MNTQSLTPETDAMLIENAEDDCGNPFDGVDVDFARKLERERDELRAALAACKEDIIELLGERGWWKDESRCGYSERYHETAENIRRAQSLLTPSAPSCDG